MILEVDDKKVFASDAGQTFDKNKQTIVLLHGSGQSHVVWSLTEQYLASKNFNVLTIDLPGHGDSNHIQATSLAEIAEITAKHDKDTIRATVAMTALIFLRSFTLAIPVSDS